MTLTDVGVVFSLMAGALSIVSIVYLAGVKIAQLEVKTNTIWEFLMRRALGEAVAKGAGTVNSPLIITDEAKSWFKDLAPALQKFYRDHGSKMSESALALAIERQFGDAMILGVCIPHGITNGACLLIAIAVAKDTDALSPLPGS